jgi:hypothetical protein
MCDLSKARLGCIDPNTLAELLQLTPQERVQLLTSLRSAPQALRADGTVPIEVGLRASTLIREQPIHSGHTQAAA